MQMRFLILSVLFCLLKTCLCGKGRHSDSFYCQQQQNSLICDGKGKMDSIPKIPTGITTLDIKNGNFIRLRRNTFKSLSGSSIKILKMQNCRIQKIDREAFYYLRYIITLDLSKNTRLKPEELEYSLHGLSYSYLEELHLLSMNWTNLPNKTFTGLSNTSISKINLKMNRLRSLDGNVFKDLKKLKTLNLAWNGIQDKSNNFSGLFSIEELILTGNWFLFFPNFCDKNGQSFVPKLKYLKLDLSKIASLYEPITCLDNLQYLNLSGLSLRLLYRNTFSQLRSLNELTMHQLGTQFRQIHDAAFNSSSLRVLRLSISGDFSFTDSNAKHFNPSILFRYSRNLETLDLSHNVIELSDHIWKSMFHPLKNLKSLNMRHAHIRRMPSEIPGLFPSLELLDLSANRICSWNGEKPFIYMENLKNLNLAENRIAIINQTSFPKSWLTGQGSLRKLLLAYNPFSCSCGIKWFREWMDMFEARNISSDKNTWKCSITETKVVYYQPMETFQCLAIYIFSSLACLFVALLVIFIIYLCRFRIKLFVYMYRCKTKKCGFNLLSDRPFLYDVFVAYSYKDLPWIQNNLIPTLETDYGRKLCIRDRDFRVGTVFSNDIIENIESSKTVLLILSDHFAKDKWCDFQLSVAVHLNVTKNTPTIIPIMLNNISFKNMSGPIYNVISTMDYGVWSEGGSAEEHFWTKILQHVPESQNVEEYCQNAIN